MNIIEKDFVFFGLRSKTKKTILKEISQKSFKLNLISDPNILYDAFLNREKETSTGFEQGFAIPHARSKVIKRPVLLFCKLNNGVDWESLDGMPTKYLFVILVPEENNNNIHMEILSTISLLLLDKGFSNLLINSKDEKEISDLINKKLQQKIEISKNENINKFNYKKDRKFILALTACPVGVAHTYLAAEKLKLAADEENIFIKIETHGSAGVKNTFTNEDIEKADLVLVCSDIGLNLSRFEGKKVYHASIKSAIHKPKETIQNAYENAKIFKTNSIRSENIELSKEKNSIMKHILSGISYMVPFVILGGICIALSLGLGKIIYGDNKTAPVGDFLWYIEQIGSTSFTLMIGALGAYIAHSIAGRAAIAPAFIVCVIANTASVIFPIGGIKVETAMGFIGSILFGISIGYTVKWINSWNINKNISSIMPIFVIPLGVGLFYSLIAIFVIGAPIGFIMDKFTTSLKNIFENNDNISIISGIGFGILFGSMAGFDMGGPINKVAFLTCSALITSKIYQPMGMMAAAIPVAPLGMAVCTFIFKNKFNENEKTMGVSAFVMGLVGISEGAIPFAISDPKRAIVSNVVGSAIAGAIAGAFGVTCAAAHGGPIVGILGAISSDKSYGLAGGIGFFFVAIIIGTLVTAFMYGFLRKVDTINTANNSIINQNSVFKKLFNKNKINSN